MAAAFAASVSGDRRASRPPRHYAFRLVTRSRALIALLSLALALPSAAFAQGAGDEQYQDPFGDEQTQGGGGGGGGRAAQDDDDGLSDQPPVDPGGEQPAPPPEEPAPEPEARPALPNTGSDPRAMAFFGLLFVLVGVGLRLRTVDPDEY